MPEVARIDPGRSDPEVCRSSARFLSVPRRSVRSMTEEPTSAPAISRCRNRAGRGPGGRLRTRSTPRSPWTATTRTGRRRSGPRPLCWVERGHRRPWSVRSRPAGYAGGRRRGSRVEDRLRWGHHGRRPAPRRRCRCRVAPVAGCCSSTYRPQSRQEHLAPPISTWGATGSTREVETAARARRDRAVQDQRGLAGRTPPWRTPRATSSASSSARRPARVDGPGIVTPGLP